MLTVDSKLESISQGNGPSERSKPVELIRRNFLPERQADRVRQHLQLNLYGDHFPLTNCVGISIGKNVANCEISCWFFLSFRVQFVSQILNSFRALDAGGTSVCRSQDLCGI